jgi:hypothetical protein
VRAIQFSRVVILVANWSLCSKCVVQNEKTTGVKRSISPDAEMREDSLPVAIVICKAHGKIKVLERDKNSSCHLQRQNEI